ncbi:MAG: hypothetical protein HY078_16580 [Elusimicrobia bacterium]|nr:hypothetical protein [Elusimicrobiota bacterium]
MDTAARFAVFSPRVLGKILGAAAVATIGLSISRPATQERGGSPADVSYEESFLPPNDIRIPERGAGPHAQEAGGLSREQYDEVLDRIQAVYGPIIAARGGVLDIDRKWEDPQFNAFAFPRRGTNVYKVQFPGGLPRHPSVTQDGFTAVACHELGHHLGGAPAGPSGLSNEGESDYFANLKCLRRVFSDGAAAGFTKADDDEVAVEGCARSFRDAGERILCIRAVTAGRSLARALQVASNLPVEPRFDTPDPAVVAQTNNAHPKPQCRLDTYFQASVCTQPVSIDLGAVDPAVGACTRSQGFSAGLRPRCWYKPPAGEGELVAGAVRETLLAPQTMAALTNPGLWDGL